MKVKNLVMFLVLAVSLLLVAGCGTNMLEFAADEDSTEACEYKASKDLNDGEWQDVIDSSCAGPMQKGAAYFGLAGYDTTDIIDRMLEANDETGDEIEVYLNNLVGVVSTATLTNLKASLAQYQAVAAGDSNKEDADFYVDIFINPMIGLSTLKGIVDPDGNGIDSDCDNNANGTPDEVDAASCSLIRATGAANSGCSAISGTTITSEVASLTFVDYDATYTGLNIQIAGSDPDCTTSTYKNLLSGGMVAVTTSDDCAGSDGGTWNCPFESGGAAIDLVDELANILNDADSTVGALVGSDDSEVDDAIEELRSDICGTDGVCTNQEVSDYLQTL